MKKEMTKEQVFKGECYVMLISAMLNNPKIVDEEKLSAHTSAMAHRLHAVAVEFISMMGFTEL
jgi:hypothetical protein